MHTHFMISHHSKLTCSGRHIVMKPNLLSARDEVKTTWSYTSTSIGRHGVHWVKSPFPLSLPKLLRHCTSWWQQFALFITRNMNKLLPVSDFVFSSLFLIRTSSKHKHTKLYCLEKNFRMMTWIRRYKIIQTWR